MSDDAAKREEMRSLLAGGLPTEMFPRADTPEQRDAITQRLQIEAGDQPRSGGLAGMVETAVHLVTGDDHLKKKLVISGFALAAVEHGGFTQHCETCMYFQIHRKHCELPELDLPVEPEWSCRLWRI